MPGISSRESSGLGVSTLGGGVPQLVECFHLLIAVGGDDLDWATSLPLRFPAHQTCACGFLVFSRQLSPGQEMSQHKERPPFLASPGVRLPALAFRAQRDGAGMSVMFCADRRNLSLQSHPRPVSQGCGHRGQERIGIPAFLLVAQWPLARQLEASVCSSEKWTILGPTPAGHEEDTSSGPPSAGPRAWHRASP